MMRDLGPGGARVSRALRKVRRVLTAVLAAMVVPALALALLWDALDERSAAAMLGSVIGIVSALVAAMWVAWAVEMDEGL